MTVVITIIHVFVAISLVLVVLLQSGKGADMGAAFGGASQTIFGSSGAATFLGRLTAAAAIIFMITSLSLTVIGGSKTSSVMPETAKSTAVKPQEAKPASTQEVPAK
ncbi:MAG: protein translocase subunit [Deltaproteobacteria bacterium]|nr:protein translocase subunit [Deltaproteobacteria bacterium]